MHVLKQVEAARTCDLCLRTRGQVPSEGVLVFGVGNGQKDHLFGLVPSDDASEHLGFRLAARRWNAPGGVNAIGSCGKSGVCDGLMD